MMSQPNRKATNRPELESLESRALLSGMEPVDLMSSTRLREASALFGLPIAGGIKTDPAAVAAVVDALRGGAGSEFVTLIRRVPNLNAVLAGFASGRTTQFTTPGIAAKIPKFQEAYTGTRYDHLTATLAGGVVLNNGVLELAVVTRGPFDEASPSYVVFGLDRGAGGSRGPLFASRPGITPDALVTIAVGPYGANPTASVTDLTTGITTPIDPARAQVRGAVARVFVDPALIPSRGRPFTTYRFAAWTRSQPDGGIENVGSFVAETNMVAVGVLKPVRPGARGR